ncbi:MAG TPA: Cys-Cys-COOH (seleno)protein SaoC [Syntrophorhabdaceae bacterium]|nr:Cys-Cys-COOH (seleno)protein SaoC [Syntrophorhabdaceae bacterium]
MKKVWLSVLSLFVLIACQSRTPVGDVAGERAALQKSPLYRCFAEMYPGKDVLIWALKDVDNDGRNDLILVYRVDKEKNAMRVVLDSGGTYVITNDVPAPVSNQIITFKNIDEKPPVEFVVQGMKGTHVGYAIYRIEKGELVDLFGDGMEECC